MRRQSVARISWRKREYKSECQQAGALTPTATTTNHDRDQQSNAAERLSIHGSDSDTEISQQRYEEELSRYLSCRSKKFSLPVPNLSGDRSDSESTSSSCYSETISEVDDDDDSQLPSPCPSPFGGDDEAMGSSTPKSAKSASTSKSYRGESRESTSSKESGTKKKRKKLKLSKAAESHTLVKMKSAGYGRCKCCDVYIYFYGYECTECRLISHKKCLKKMTIVCAKEPLPLSATVVVGCELANIPEDVPPIVVKCATEIERRAFHVHGIYRTSGSASRVEKLLKSFESGPHLIDLTDVNPNDLATCLKQFLRELTEPLISNDVYKEIIEIGRSYSTIKQAQEQEHEEEKEKEQKQPQQQKNSAINCDEIHELVSSLSEVVNRLHPRHLSTLAFLMHHLKRISDHESLNAMNGHCLGIVFAPTIFRPRGRINDLYVEVFEAMPQARAIELMIINSYQIFGPPGEVEFLFPTATQELSSTTASMLTDETEATTEAISLVEEKLMKL